MKQVKKVIEWKLGAKDSKSKRERGKIKRNRADSSSSQSTTNDHQDRWTKKHRSKKINKKKHLYSTNSRKLYRKTLIGALILFLQRKKMAELESIIRYYSTKAKELRKTDGSIYKGEDEKRVVVGALRSTSCFVCRKGSYWSVNKAKSLEIKECIIKMIKKNRNAYMQKFKKQK